jgi:hypothetical protein
VRIVAMTVRHADKDDVVNGMKIPAGTSIFLAPGVTNFDPKSWGPDVDVFNPDRWDNLPDSVSNYSFLTFLQGIPSLPLPPSLPKSPVLSFRSRCPLLHTSLVNAFCISEGLT